MQPKQQIIADEVARSVPWWHSFAFRFVALYTSVALAVLVAGVIQAHRSQKADIESSFGRTLRSIAATAAPQIPGDLLREIRSNADVDKPAFRKLYALLDQVRRENGLGKDRIYILRRADKPDTYRFVVMLHERPFVGDVYRPPPALARLYRERVFGQGVAAQTPLFSDENGRFISGVAPIRDASGAITAMLHADFGVGRYLRAVEVRTRLMLGAVGGVAALFLAFGWLMHRRLRAAAIKLLRGTEAIEREQYDHVVEFSTRDELARVGSALNQTLGRLRERFEMLKFIPDHTARMIEAAIAGGGVNLEIARRVEVTIMETDIRGFTQLSQKVTPEQVIALLNLYIRAQAELVAAAEGSIDKFMGDAVLAVFEGPGKEERAVRCALAIQDAIDEINRTGPGELPVQIGVGITTGEVVMGNMGSEQRMEHTVIGSAVNLAARLCSEAGPGEIMIAASMWAETADTVELAAGDPEHVRVKGFAEPVACYRLRASRSDA